MHNLRKTRRGAAAVLSIAIGSFACSAEAAEAGQAAPLPPPPELLDGGYYDPTATHLESLPAWEPEEKRQALEPPVTIVPDPAVPWSEPAAHDSSAYAPTTYIPPANAQPIDATAATIAAAPIRVQQPLARMHISPPSAFMPADYFNLPMVEDGIPGVILPELDDAFRDAGQPAAPVGRPAIVGLSIRQLEPYFALAKGTEGAALDAAKRNEDEVYKDQLRKSVDAYRAIVDMADAGTEAREEAWYGIARCEYRLGNWWQSFEALERSFPKRFERQEVEGRIKLEMFIGERLWRLGEETIPDAVSKDGQLLNGYQSASQVYARAVYNQPAASDAPVALLRRGDAAAMEQNWEEAAKFYRQVVEYYPESESAQLARASLAETIYKRYPKELPEAGRDDLGNIMDDVERARNNLSEEAAERRQRVVAMANEREAEPKLRQAKEYLKSMRLKKSRDAAVFLLGDIVSFYPNTPQAMEAAEILRGMGIEPPMVLSDGDKFPITSGASGRELAAEGEDPGFGGGSVQLEGQNDIGSGLLPPSPTRETVYESFFVGEAAETP